MSTKERFSEANINKANHIFSQTRTTVQTAFFQNNMEEVTSPAQAYYLPKTIPIQLFWTHQLFTLKN